MYELGEFNKETTKQILILKEKVVVLEDIVMRQALNIHNLQKHTGTHPHEDKEEEK
jgi:hypothetical protein